MTPDDKVKAGVVGVRKRRGRRNGLTEATGRKLPPLPENLRAEVKAARQAHAKRPASPGVRVYSDGADGWMLDAPHRDLEAWEIQICEAFGTRSHSTMWTFLNQIAGLCAQNWRADIKGDGGRWVPDELELNFILALIHSERPETPLQAAVLAQMCATHMMQMRIAGNALGSSWIDPLRGALVAKLANASANQAETYLKLRGKAPKQNITVTYKREVHVHHHKHAHLHQNPPVEGAADFLERADDPKRCPENQTGERSPTLPGPDAPGNVVPLARNAGEGSVPQARRRARLGRAKG